MVNTNGDKLLQAVLMLMNLKEIYFLQALVFRGGTQITGTKKPARGGLGYWATKPARWPG